MPLCFLVLHYRHLSTLPFKEVQVALLSVMRPVQRMNLDQQRKGLLPIIFQLSNAAFSSPPFVVAVSASMYFPSASIGK